MINPPGWLISVWPGSDPFQMPGIAIRHVTCDLRWQFNDPIFHAGWFDLEKITELVESHTCPKQKKLSRKLKADIKNIPGSDGWFHDGWRQFEEIAESLLEIGLDEIQVLETLEHAYSAVANEFGS